MDYIGLPEGLFFYFLNQNLYQKHRYRPAVCKSDSDFYTISPLLFFKREQRFVKLLFFEQDS
ncbi:MAG TPA: hypothetical protein DIT94_15000 [Deltaproteobacteria bacterium]|nr:hypothetical protein [Deltaproteobacteria bacterium]HCP35698.1 hypothetical protein [Deltaproteobacteria bacterium]